MAASAAPGTPRAPSPDAADRRDSETREIRQSAGNGQARDDQARTNGQPRAELGVNLAASRTIGTRIVSVDPESAAARAGIQNGDYILSINGEATNSPREVQDAIRELDAGSEIKLSIWRNGETHDMTASLGERRGMKLWNAKLDDGRGLAKAVQWIAPYAAGQAEWPYKQIQPPNRERVAILFRRAAVAYGRPDYEQISQMHCDPDDDDVTIALALVYPQR